MPFTKTTVLLTSNGGCGHVSHVPPITSTAEPPFVVSELAQVFGCDAFLQNCAIEGCVTPRTATAITKLATFFALFVLVIAHSTAAVR
jgi:hypothetical protein